MPAKATMKMAAILSARNLSVKILASSSLALVVVSLFLPAASRCDGAAPSSYDGLTLEFASLVDGALLLLSAPQAVLGNGYFLKDMSAGWFGMPVAMFNLHWIASILVISMSTLSLLAKRAPRWLVLFAIVAILTTLHPMYVIDDGFVCPTRYGFGVWGLGCGLAIAASGLAATRQ